ncbi:MAG: hypothetical protein ACPLWD_02530 [Caldimicrobium thiodismutans]
MVIKILRPKFQILEIRALYFQLNPMSLRQSLPLGIGIKKNLYI